MTQQTVISQRFSTYHHTSHVIFQFILVEFLRVQSPIKKLKNASLEMEATFSSKDHEAYIRHLKELIAATETLTGTASPFKSNFSWNPANGIFTKMKNDSFLFEKAFSKQFPEASSIKKQVAKCWTHCAEMRDLAEQMILEPFSNDYLQFQKIEKKMLSSLKILGKEIAKALLHFHSNENVLLCIISHKEQLDSIFGHKFTLKTIRKMHTDALNLQKFLLEAYTKRGFDGLSQKIYEKIKTLQNYQ